ncbi:unnamed protein product [Ambrosiozyma monospora]|uniref:Unnamed protein product n=1 Tax=Ambrosiozyma monospora TaxID=43982 RepID=A0ACB5TMM9_AMBMO|nr:unnamed protein product [Ambrosiozyma monospora]
MTEDEEVELSLYEILGVDSKASSVEIRRSYRKLALQYHPDKVAESERDSAAAKFKKISHAYEVLIDEEKRGNYDKYGTYDGSVPARAAGDDFDIPTSSFGGAAFAGSNTEFDPQDFAKFFNNIGKETSKTPYRPRDTTKSEDAVLHVELNLDDLRMQSN